MVPPSTGGSTCSGRWLARPFHIRSLTSISRHQGHVGAALILGGVDATGPHPFTIHPHGSTDKLPYVTMGSGSLAAMTVFEAQWKPNLTVCEIVLRPRSQLTRHQSERKPSISCIFNDLGSGSNGNVDACVIIATKTDMLRNFVKPNERVTKERTDDFCRGTTAFTNSVEEE
jgi:20S proteasome subunit beta 2